MVVIIDNYDSFVYNLARYVKELGYPVQVHRNDAITAQQVAALSPDAIILSPGPRGPEQSGVCLDIVRRLGDRVPMLGVCLGHQVMAHVLGAYVTRAKQPQHGKTSWLNHTGQGLFRHVAKPLQATRYHSLIVDADSLDHTALQATAWSPRGELMAMQHQEWPLYGVQFHPESILTQQGNTLLMNFFQEVTVEAVA